MVVRRRRGGITATPTRSRKDLYTNGRVHPVGMCLQEQTCRGMA